MNRTKTVVERCVATEPGNIPLVKCRSCAGRGCQPTAGKELLACAACEGHGWEGVAGNLGPTRAHPVKGRGFTFNAGSGQLTVTRGRRTEGYCVRELIHDQVPGGEPTRAFEVARTTGERAGEVYHLLVAPSHVTCDCPGKSYEATARADGRAYLNGAAIYRTCGCVHADAVTLLLAAGQFDVPQGPVEVDEAFATRLA